MSYIVDLQPSGLFTLSTAGGRVLFDGAFRGDIPEKMRVAEANLIAEAPDMFALLGAVAQEIDAAIKGVIDQNGGGPAGQKMAMDQAPGLFRLREVLTEQIARAAGKMEPA